MEGKAVISRNNWKLNASSQKVGKIRHCHHSRKRYIDKGEIPWRTFNVSRSIPDHISLSLSDDSVPFSAIGSF